MGIFAAIELSATMIWLILVIVFLLIESATVCLTSIWVAGGSLAGLILSLFDVPVYGQVAGAIVVTIVLLLFTKPFAMKYINKNKEKTNCDTLIGQTICVKETINNLMQTGSAVVNGQEWTVRAVDDTILETGMLVDVVEIAGVKLIVKKHKEDL